MNKLFTKVVKLVLGLSLAAGVGVAVETQRKTAEKADATTINGEFVAHTSAITEGDYVFYSSYTVSGTGYTQTMSNTVSSNKIASTSLSLSNNKVVNPDDSVVWHIAPSGNYWTIQNVNNSKYVAATGSKSQANLSTESDSKCLFSFEYANSHWNITSKYNKLF